MTNSNYHLLIVDDDARNVFALKATLRSRGFNCHTAASAQEAFVILNSGQHIDLILLDMMMPDMDGYETLHQLNNSNDLKEIPVIAVTAQAMTGDREKCLDAGASEYLSKPIDVDKMTNLLSSFLSNG